MTLQYDMTDGTYLRISRKSMEILEKIYKIGLHNDGIHLSLIACPSGLHHGLWP